MRIVDPHRRRWRIERHCHALAVVALVRVALQREPVPPALVAVYTESALAHLPGIKRSVIWMNFRVAPECHSINSKVRSIAVACSVPERTRTLIHVSGAARDQQPARFCGVFRDDVNHAVDGIRAPYRSSWAANHLDALNILKHHVLHVPIHAREKRAVDASP